LKTGGNLKFTPRKAIPKMCRECTGGKIALCYSPNCKLYPYRYAANDGTPELSPLKAVKSHCLECTGYEYQETKNCTDLKCPLYPYRLGKNPQLKGIGRVGGNPNIRNIRTLSKITNRNSVLTS